MRFEDIPESMPCVDAADSDFVEKVEPLLAFNRWAISQFVGSGAWTNSSLLEPGCPFSFCYKGRPSAEFLGSWDPSTDIGGEIATIKRKDPSSGLSITTVLTASVSHPSADWVLYFENEGTEDTPIIEDIQPLDILLKTADPSKPVILHRINGDTEDENSFLPFDTELWPGQTIKMGPKRGKSSTDEFPFFNVQYGDEGIIVAIGWTGQWAATLERDETGATRLRAGMGKTHLKLHPGEKIRTPRILIMQWKGDLAESYNTFRRLMLFIYVPKLDGKPIKMPVALHCFDRYVQVKKVPGWTTEEGQLRAVEVAHKLGCDTFWLDAGWFPDDFPAGIGNWIPKPYDFPNGLKPISDKCHELDLKFLLWFEPERATGSSIVAKEHPEFLYPNYKTDFGGESYLFNLGNPEARRWTTDLMSKCITEWGVDIYRNDLNVNPLAFWQANDAPDRQGMSEIMHITGLYEMWDELLQRHPGLFIDNVSGGGRRIDLETCMRSVPLWRSDTGCGDSPIEWNQTQSYGLSHYIPLHSVSAWYPSAYCCRSTATAGVICEWDYLSEDFSMEAGKEALAELVENQKYWYGDFYPLASCTKSSDAMIAWQLHRADLDSGIAVAFRRKDCEDSSLRVRLRGVNPLVTYTVEFFTEDRKKTSAKMTGKELAEGIELLLEKKLSSLLVRYSHTALEAK